MYYKLKIHLKQNIYCNFLNKTTHNEIYRKKRSYLLISPLNMHLEKLISGEMILDNSLVNNVCKLTPSCL